MVNSLAPLGNLADGRFQARLLEYGHENDRKPAPEILQLGTTSKAYPVGGELGPRVEPLLIL